MLQNKLSLPVSSYCQLINESIIGPHTINKRERLEVRLEKEASRILSKYKILKGQHRSLHKAKTVNILLFQGEISEPEDAPARLKIAGECRKYIAIALGVAKGWPGGHMPPISLVFPTKCINI